MSVFDRPALLLPVSLALLLLPAHSAAERVWARFEAPDPWERVREPVGLVEVRGFAGTGIPGNHDVVLLIDRSGSTWAPTGIDVDGDRIVGETFHVEIVPGQPIHHLTDPDDSIASAQLTAARRLIERLDSETTRMGIVSFDGSETVRAAVGATAAQLLDVLHRLPSRPRSDGTYFYGAIMAAIELLQQAPRTPQRRHRSIVLLSDGLPNRPLPRSAAYKAAIRAAVHAANSRIRIYSFALGQETARNPGVFADLTRANRGELTFVEQPGDVVDFVPYISLTRLTRVEIDNLSLRRPARAVRLFPDGSFDGYAPLEAGENRLRITAFGEAGGRVSTERSVYFEKLPGQTPGLRARSDNLIEQMRTRTLETELAAEARKRRARLLQRSVEIQLGSAPPTPEPAREPPD